MIGTLTVDGTIRVEATTITYVHCPSFPLVAAAHRPSFLGLHRAGTYTISAGGVFNLASVTVNRFATHQRQLPPACTDSCSPLPDSGTTFNGAGTLQIGVAGFCMMPFGLAPALLYAGAHSRLLLS
jgi:hypothetical protein